MKRKLFTGIAAVLLISGLMMLIAPRISNRVGEQIAHTTIEDFKTLKSKATSDEATEKKESSEDSLSYSNQSSIEWRIKYMRAKLSNIPLANSSFSAGILVFYPAIVYDYDKGITKKTN